MTKTSSAGTAKKPAKFQPKQSHGTQLLRLVARKSGATSAQIQAALGWQPHTARAAKSRLRKAGYEIERQNSGKGSVYRIVTDGSPK